jgi:hypothetical protein
MLGLLPLQQLEVPPGGFEDTIVHPGGQRITIKLNPIQGSVSSETRFQLEVIYAEAKSEPANSLGIGWKRLLTALKGYDEIFSPRKLTWLTKATVSAVIIIIASVILWRTFFLRSVIPPQKVPDQPPRTELSQNAELKTPPAPIQSPRGRVPTSRGVSLTIAKVSWSTDPTKALKSIPLELTRAEARTVEPSGHQMSTSIGLPVYDDHGNRYTEYRLTISMANQLLWQQSLTAPPVSLTGYANIVDFVLFTERLPKGSSYSLNVTARTTGRWEQLGTVTFSPRSVKAHK